MSVRRLRGFTLIELIVVILVIGLLATIALVGYNAFTDRADRTRAIADLRQLATAVLAEATVTGAGEISRDMVLQVMRGSADVTDGFTAASWELGLTDDAPTSSDQFAVGFDQFDSNAVSTAGPRAALVTATPAGEVYATVITVHGTATAPAVLAPEGTTPSIVLGAIPDGGSAPVFDDGNVALPPGQAKLTYPETQFRYGAVNEQLSPQLTGVSGATWYSVSGDLPDSVTFDGYTGTLTGPSGWDVALVAADSGDEHTLAVTADGVVYAWGTGTSGQLGQGNTTSSVEPVAVTSGSLAGKKVVAVAAGLAHSLALDDTGTVHGWGSSQYGRVGNGTTGNVTSPVEIDGGSLAGKHVIAIAAGDFGSAAVTSDGSVHVWGYNAYGELGTGSTGTSQLVPVRVSGGSLAGKTVTNVDVGRFFTVASTDDGGVHAWGLNNSGQLGTGDTTNRTTPTQVVTGSLDGKTVTALSAGEVQTLAVASDGTLHGWGPTSYTCGQHQMRILPGTGSVTPVQLGDSLTGRHVVAVDINRHALAVTSDGALHAWGCDSHHAAGGWTTGPTVLATGTLAGRAVTDVSVGEAFSIVVADDGTAHAFGRGRNGELGWHVGLVDVSAPAPVPTFAGLSGFPFTVTITAHTPGGTVSSGPVTFSWVKSTELDIPDPTPGDGTEDPLPGEGDNNDDEEGQQGGNPAWPTPNQVITGLVAATSVPTYGAHGPHYMVDGNESTWHWGSRALLPGDWYTVDLGAVHQVTNVRIAGAAAHPSNRIRAGVLEASPNACSNPSGDWTELTTDVDHLVIDVPVDNVEAQCIRLRATMAGSQWPLLAEFTVTGRAQP